MFACVTQRICHAFLLRNLIEGCVSDQVWIWINGFLITMIVYTVFAKFKAIYSKKYELKTSFEVLKLQFITKFLNFGTSSAWKYFIRCYPHILKFYPYQKFKFSFQFYNHWNEFNMKIRYPLLSGRFQILSVIIR